MAATERTPEQATTEWMKLYLPPGAQEPPPDHLSAEAICELLTSPWVNDAILHLRSQGHPIDELTTQLQRHGAGILFARWRHQTGTMTEETP